MRVAVDLVEALCNELRMFGVPLDGPAYVFWGNQSVTNAARTGAHTLQKKHNTICCHRVQEASGSELVIYLEHRIYLTSLPKY